VVTPPPRPAGPGRPLDKFAICHCKQRVRLIWVPPSPYAPGAKPVIGYLCPLCDTTNR
jgi:hypothetical protein